MANEGMNLVVINGNVGASELRFTGSGTAVLNMRVAVNERIKSGEEWKDHVEWFSVAMFGKRAESLAKIIDKGTGVAVRGKLRSSKYTDKDKIERQKWEIIAEDLYLTGGGKRGDGAGAGGQRPAQGQTAAPQWGGDNDLPF